jgi:sulfotransferase
VTTRKFHFISGLPRSGSTLLSAILRQNPRFQAGISSPVGSLFQGMLRNFSAGSEWAALIDHAKRRALMAGLFDSYYSDLAPEREVVFDTNRMWCSKLPAVIDLFPEAKVICCVRNVAWIMDSLERLYRANPYENTLLFNNDTERNTVFSRVDTLAQRDRLVGFAWSALKEAFYSEQAESLLLVDYDLLTAAPARVMTLIYQFLEEPAFAHDYQNLVLDTPEFDSALGLKGLHKVRPKVEAVRRSTLLPPDLFEQHAKMSFWKDPRSSRANVIAIGNENNLSTSQETAS